MKLPELHNNQAKTLKGFTLLEVMVYIVVFSMVVGGMAAITLGIYRHKTIIEDRVNINEDLRLLTKSLRDDIYLSNDIDIVGGTTLTVIRNSADDVVYYLSNGRVFRQEGTSSAIAITAITTDVRRFDLTDLSSPDSGKTVRLHTEIANFPGGSLKPEIAQDVTTTFSLKFL